MALRTLFKFERKENEGEEKNSSSTQAKGGRREKSSLTTQENFLGLVEVREMSSIYRWGAKDELQIQWLGLIDLYKINNMISPHK